MRVAPIEEEQKRSNSGKRKTDYHLIEQAGQQFQAGNQARLAANAQFHARGAGQSPGHRAKTLSLLVPTLLQLKDPIGEAHTSQPQPDAGISFNTRSPSRKNGKRRIPKITKA